MNNATFMELVRNQFKACEEMLSHKHLEYSPGNITDDVLHQFKVAANLYGCDPKGALAGMMLKHTISIYDMVKRNSEDYAMWDEKITDHINYLLLLKAILDEEEEERLDYILKNTDSVCSDQNADRKEKDNVLDNGLDKYVQDYIKFRFGRVE